MSFIRIIIKRGTSVTFHNPPLDRWKRDENLKQRTKFANPLEGQKITVNKGTNSKWIKKEPRLGFPPTSKTLIVNKGTKRLILEPQI